MHKDSMKGAAKDAKGSMKKNVGRAAGDEALEAEGMTDQAAGKTQRAFGDVKESARRALKH